jgi:PAS domain S-box-containing protein
MKAGRILIVDDEESNIKLLEGMLRPENYHVFGCLSGEEALQNVFDKRPDLILLDIMMPGINGFEVCERLKNDEMTRMIPVLMVTALNETEHLANAVDAGADDLLKKPIDQIELRVRVRSLLRIKSHYDELLDRHAQIAQKNEDLLREISERREVEEALQHAHEELESKVNIRTAELYDTNQQLKQEISERRRIEEDLRHSEKRFRDLVENSLIGIAIIQDNQIIYQNPEQEKIFKPTPGRTIVQDLKRVHPDDLKRLKKAYRRILAGKVQSVASILRLNPADQTGINKEMRWVQCRATSFQYHGADAILVNAIDITTAKQLEHQLLIKNKMLSLGRVAAGIAHEIRNPLTGINSYLYTLEDLCDSEELEPDDIQMMRQIVEQIQVASDKINLVIKRVMDFSKPGTPKMVLVNINESIEEAVKLSNISIRRRGITIEKSLAQNLPRCYADPLLIEQVVINLVTNAANAMKKTNGSKIIKIGSFSENNTLFIKISDSGPGVPLELKEKIFDPFFTTDEDGSGIGLNIAQRIVADHNGSIALDTGELGGAEFRIELPIERRMYPR